MIIFISFFITCVPLLVLINLAQKSLPFFFNLNWAPFLKINLSFIFDPLSIFFSLVVSIIGLFVLFYSYFFFKNQKNFSPSRFYSYLIIFIISMLGTILANNLVLLFIFWELTGIASFLLIGFNYKNQEAKSSAIQSLLITLGTGLVMLVGFVYLSITSSSFIISEIITKTELLNNPAINIILILILIGAFGKSAQFPFHTWLPKAMAAPTPVSAYLHSAAMVKLGIFLVARFYPLFKNIELWSTILIIIGCLSMTIGGLKALKANKIKALLAYCTITQLGVLFLIYGMDPLLNISQNYFHILNHVFYKSSLFMCAGIIISATSISHITNIKGLGKHLPLTALSTILAALCMAGFPITSGFISKELLLSQSLGLAFQKSGLFWLIPIIIFISSSCLVICSLRLIKLFFGKKPTTINIKKTNIFLQLPGFILAVGTILLSIYYKINHINNPIKINHIETYSLLISLFIYATSLTIFYNYFVKNKKSKTIQLITNKLNNLKPDIPTLFNQSIHTIYKFLRYHRPMEYLYIILSFFIITMSIGIFSNLSSTKLISLFQFDTIGILEVFVLIFIAVLSFAVVIVRSWPGRLICLSITGFLTSFFFMLHHAPDLALTQMLIEVVTLILFLLLLGRFPKMENLNYQESSPSLRKKLSIIIASCSGIIIFILVLLFNTSPPVLKTGDFYLNNTVSLAHGQNAVNTILVDFRGFDTLGEISVLAIALLGVLGILMKQNRQSDKKSRLWQKKLKASVITKTLSPYIAAFMLLLALYFFLKGHNQPGGGFIAGTAAAISLLMLEIIFGAGKTKKLLRVDPINIAIIGLFISYGSAIMPVFKNQAFLTHSIATYTLPLIKKINLTTAMLFDFGISLLVFGVVAKIAFTFSIFSESRITYIVNENENENENTNSSENIIINKEDYNQCS